MAAKYRNDVAWGFHPNEALAILLAFPPEGYHRISHPEDFSPPVFILTA